MNRYAFLIVLLTSITAPPLQAAPALGPSISVDANPTYRRPVQPRVQTNPQLARKPVLTAPQNMRQLGTHGSMNAEIPVQRQRGSAGSLNLTYDISLRPAF